MSVILPFFNFNEAKTLYLFKKRIRVKFTLYVWLHDGIVAYHSPYDAFELVQ